MSKKQPETTYNNLKRPERTYNEQETAWNDTQRVRRNLQWPEHFYDKQKRRRETTNNKQILRLFCNMEQMVLFSNTFSTQHLVAVIQALLHGKSWWKQSVKHLLSYVKRQLSCVIFTGYKIYFFCLGEAIFLAPLFHFHPLRKSFGLQRLHLSGRFDDERGLGKRIQEPYYIFLLSKPP